MYIGNVLRGRRRNETSLKSSLFHRPQNDYFNLIQDVRTNSGGYTTYTPLDGGKVPQKPKIGENPLKISKNISNLPGNYHEVQYPKCKNRSDIQTNEFDKDKDRQSVH